MKKAVFTIVKDEDFFLPIWLKHYKKYFDKSDIYVLDHNSTDGSTLNLDCNVIKVDYDKAFDHQWLTYTVSNFQVDLLKIYDYVLFAEADEIVEANLEKYSGLDELIDNADFEAIRCTGRAILHIPDEEPDLIIDQPLLKQRKYWTTCMASNKVLLSNCPLIWLPGFHSTADRFRETLPDDRLFCIHLHKIDWNKNLERNQKRAKMQLSQRDVMGKLGEQNYTLNIEKISDYFYQDIHLIEKIPEIYRNIL